jgi:hypothetical protein
LNQEANFDFNFDDAPAQNQPVDLDDLLSGGQTGAKAAKNVDIFKFDEVPSPVRP